MEKILFVPHPILRQKANPLNKITFRELDIAKRMTDIMLEAPGVGLAANQIGILKKIITVNIPDDTKDENKIYTLFNPNIISYSSKKIFLEEGCLSLPKQYADIERPEEIEIEYFNNQNCVILNKTYHHHLPYPPQPPYPP